MPIKIYFIVVVEYYSKNTMPFMVSQRAFSILSHIMRFMKGVITYRIIRYNLSFQGYIEATAYVTPFSVCDPLILCQQFLIFTVTHSASLQACVQ